MNFKSYALVESQYGVTRSITILLQYLAPLGIFKIRQYQNVTVCVLPAMISNKAQVIDLSLKPSVPNTNNIPVFYRKRTILEHTT